ncbi:retrovirus-related pol polyprotein from transposon TNT 1-94 [Tanacetum coccineum]
MVKLPQFLFRDLNGKHFDHQVYVSVEGLGHNLFSIRQFCDSNLEVAFRNNTCFVRNLGGVDLLKGNRTTKLYTINLHEMASASPICLMARATSTKSKDEEPKVIKTFLKRIIVLLQSHVIIIRTNNKNQILKEYFDSVGISHQASSVRTPQQNGVVNDREDIVKLGAKGNISFFIGYSADSCAYRVYNRRTKKIMETMNVTFDELSAMDFGQSSSKLGLQSMTFGQINDYSIGGQPSAAPRTTPAAQAPQDFNELETQQQHVQHQPATIADNVPNVMFDDNTFVNPFATPSTSAAESSSLQYEPVAIMDREVRSLKRSKISLVKVHCNSKCGPEFTWERKDHMKSKYPQLFVDRAVELAS